MHQDVLLLEAMQLSCNSEFPKGLRVLLLDGDALFLQQAAQQLRLCAYRVTTCSSPSEAVALLRRESQGGSSGKFLSRRAAGQNCPSFDVMLVEARLLLPDSGTSHSRKLVKLCRTLPFILMSSAPLPDEVMLGIKLGAAEFLEKPLCQLKLKNIWQHTVRRMMMLGGAAASARGNIRLHRIGGPTSRRTSHELSACSLLNSPDSDEVVGVPCGAGTGSWDEEGSGAERPVLGVPNSPFSSGLFSSPASSASYELLLDSHPPTHSHSFIEAMQPHPPHTSTAYATSALPNNHLSIRPMPRRRSRELQHKLQQQHQKQQQHTTSPASDITSRAGSLPPPPPPPLDLMPIQRGVCAPGMPWCPPAILLPPGTEWGMPMNPMAVAPGITPPIFQPPSPSQSPHGLANASCSPPLPPPAMPHMAPQGHANCFPPPPPFPLPSAGCSQPPSSSAPMNGAALMPLPMHLLSAACTTPDRARQADHHRHQHSRDLDAKLLPGACSLLNSCELSDLELQLEGGSLHHAHNAEQDMVQGHHQGVGKGVATSSALDAPVPSSSAGAPSICRQRSGGLDTELEQLDLGLGSGGGGGFKKVDSFVDLIQPLLAC